MAAVVVLLGLIAPEVVDGSDSVVTDSLLLGLWLLLLLLKLAVLVDLEWDPDTPVLEPG